MVMSHLSDGNGLWANDNYQIKCMSAWVKKEMYFQGIRIHTDVVFDIGFFFKSEWKKLRQVTLNGKISEKILDDQNTTSCKNHCRTTRKMKKESQQILKVLKSWEADNSNAEKNRYARTTQFLVITKSKRWTETVKILLRQLRNFKKHFSSVFRNIENG